MNFWSVNEDEQRLMFGDVVGKGPRAALVVAAISAFIENSREAGESMEQCIQRINSGLCKLFSFHITSTLSAASIRSDGTIRLYNCGGVGWMRVSRESGSILQPSSMLGLDLHPKVGIREVHLAEGEALCAFSDGVLEGSRAIKKLRTDLTLLQAGKYDCDLLIQTILDNGRKNQVQDDMSMLVIVRPVKADLAEKAS